MRRLRALVWPQSLAGRITLLLVGGLMLLHIGSMWVHERTLHGIEQDARIERLADRIADLRRNLNGVAEAARDAAAHARSGPGMEFHWDRAPPIAADPAPPERWAAAALLGPGVRLAWDPKGAPGHSAVGAVPFEGGGWIVFSASWIGGAGAGMDAGGVVPTLAMAIGIALASILVIRWITGPLRRLAGAADEIGRDLRQHPVPTDGPSEVRHAALAFNAMQARIARLVEDRTEALAAMSHDLRTPLSRLKLRLGFMPEGEERARLEADIAEMETLISRTLDYIREGRDGEPLHPADLAAIMQTLASDAADQGHDIVYEGPSRAVLPVRRLAAKRALSNLVENALRHGAAPVRLAIRIEPAALVLEVSDAGPGIPVVDHARAMAPFTQLDPARGAGGTGLGLAIAQRFALGSGGRLELGLAAQGGLLARITLPRTAG